MTTPDFAEDKPAPLIVKEPSTLSSKESLRRREKVVKIQAAVRGWMVRKSINKNKVNKNSTDK